MSRRSGLLACIVAAIALVTSCGGSGDDDAAAPSDSGVEGVVLTGPTCAVQRVPPDPDCGDRLLARASVRARQGGRLVGETKTDAQGRFRLPLAPGDYQLFTSGGINPADTPVATAHVAANRFTRVELYVDTGIR